MTPEALRTLGSPWLLSCEPAGARKDVTQWPLPGFGHFLIAQRGGMLACLIPLESLIERGCEISNGIKFVTQLSWKDFGQFAATQLPFANIEVCHALWVPYGWRCILMSRSTSSICHALHIPYVSAKMVVTSPRKGTLVTLAKVAMHEWSSLKNTEQAFSWAHEAMTWLDKVFGIDGTLDHGPRIEHLSALEDIKADEQLTD